MGEDEITLGMETAEASDAQEVSDLRRRVAALEAEVVKVSDDLLAMDSRRYRLEAEVARLRGALGEQVEAYFSHCFGDHEGSSTHLMEIATAALATGGRGDG